MLEILKSKVMVCFIILMLGVGYLNSIEAKMERESFENNLITINA